MADRRQLNCVFLGTVIESHCLMRNPQSILLLLCMVLYSRILFLSDGVTWRTNQEIWLRIFFATSLTAAAQCMASASESRALVTMHALNVYDLVVVVWKAENMSQGYGEWKSSFVGRFGDNFTMTCCEPCVFGLGFGRWILAPQMVETLGFGEIVVINQNSQHGSGNAWVIDMFD